MFNESGSGEKINSKTNGMEAVLAFVCYQNPENDPSLKESDFIRRCPCCGAKFDIRLVSDDFVNEPVGRKIKFHFFMCPQCVQDAWSLHEDKLKQRLDEAVRCVALSGNLNEWSVTTDLALLVHGRDRVAAIVYGALLSNDVIEGYDSGAFDITLHVILREGGEI